MRSVEAWFTEISEEPVANVTLVEKMRRDYDVDLRALEALPEDERGLDVAAMIRAARAAVARMPRWEIREEAHLGCFTFTKFLMWKDLEENAEHLLESDVVRRLDPRRRPAGGLEHPVAEAFHDAKDGPEDRGAGVGGSFIVNLLEVG